VRRNTADKGQAKAKALVSKANDFIVDKYKTIAVSLFAIGMIKLTPNPVSM